MIFCVFEFSKYGLMIKGIEELKETSLGSRKGDLHALNLKKIAIFAAKSGKASKDLWHARLAHPHSTI